MKRTLFLIFTLATSLMAVAQSGKPAANAVLLSETRNGNTVTTRYLILTTKASMPSSMCTTQSAVPTLYRVIRQIRSR